MSDLKTQINTNRRNVIIGLAALMFLFFALINAISVLIVGFNGFQVAFSSILSNIGVARFFAILLILIPIVIVVDEFINFKANLPAKLKENFGTCMFGLGVLLAIIFAISLPTGVSLGWGGILYILFALAGIAVCNINKIMK